MNPLEAHLIYDRETGEPVEVFIGSEPEAEAYILAHGGASTLERRPIPVVGSAGTKDHADPAR